MGEKPMLFQAEMVRQILAGTKTQTRRIAKLTPKPRRKEQVRALECPYGFPGDLLWVRESFLPSPFGVCQYMYKATAPDEHEYLKWKPSIHMPRVASRITLRITDIRLHRLQKITEADAVAEGCRASGKSHPALNDFAFLWNSIHGDGSWEANPWVWVIEFVKHTETSR